MNEEPTTEDRQPVEDRGSTRSQRPASEAFRAFVAANWATRPDTLPPPSRSAGPAALRRGRIGARFPGDVLVVPAGPLVTRSNDTDYRFRPHTAFAHLTGLGTDREPDAVLVLHPVPSSDAEATTHEAVLYFRPRAGRDTEEFYADARYGELWVGVRASLEEMAAETGIRCAHIDGLRTALAEAMGAATAEPSRGPAGEGPEGERPDGDGPGREGADEGASDDADAPADDEVSTGGQIRLVTPSDPAVEALVAELRRSVRPDAAAAADGALAEALAELRLVKDDYEIEQLREAVAATVAGFEDIVRSLPRAVAHRRGERVIEAAFGARAREEGNAVGYETIVAAGDHACALHWIRNDGVVHRGELVLVDAGVEVDSLYTADVTRTLPVDGSFTSAQRQIYQAVLDAADAAFAAARPGATLRQVHDAAMAIIAARLEEWGWLPSTAAESLAPEGQYHRRWMVHGTSHHLGLDVHDCAQAHREVYLDGLLAPGMVFTIEPGLYVKADDESVPAQFRGIGVRIEDDVLVTEDGVENLSAALPRSADDVEAWVARLAGSPSR